jgi:hypothetical protein
VALKVGWSQSSSIFSCRLENPSKNCLGNLAPFFIELGPPDAKGVIGDDHVSAEHRLAAELFARYDPRLTPQQVERIARIRFESAATTSGRGAATTSGSGFDWFAAVALKIFGGQFDRCAAFLEKFWNHSAARC